MSTKQLTQEQIVFRKLKGTFPHYDIKDMLNLVFNVEPFQHYMTNLSILKKKLISNGFKIEQGEDAETSILEFVKSINKNF
jgi:hypothetical protein